MFRIFRQAVGGNELSFPSDITTAAGSRADKYTLVFYESGAQWTTSAQGEAMEDEIA